MFTVTAVARELGVSAQTVYALCAAKKLRHERHGLKGRAIRIPGDAVEEYRAGRTVSVTTDRPAPKPVKLRHLRV